MTLKGLIAPSFTPMHKDGSLANNIIPLYAETLIKNKLSGVFVCGGSGEGYLLSLQERKSITSAWCKYANEDFKVIIHVGSYRLEDAKELAVHAYENGASAISSIGPIFFKTRNNEELIGYCAQIASLTPDLPFYYYHIPSKTGLNINVADFLKKGIKKIPNLAGVKFTDSTLMDLQDCLALDQPKFDMVYGRDETLLCGLALGTTAAIGTTYNFMPALYYKMIESFEKGKLKEARNYQLLAVKVIEIMSKYKNIVMTGKIVQSWCGIDCGPCREPLTDLSDIELKNMRNDLERINFFDYAIQLP